MISYRLKNERELPPVVIRREDTLPKPTTKQIKKEKPLKKEYVSKKPMPDFDNMRYQDLLSHMGSRDLLTKEQSRKRVDLVKLAKETW